MQPAYNTQPRNYQPRSFGFTRLWIVISSVFGIIITTFIAGFYFYYLSRYNSGTMNSSEVDTGQMFLMNSYQDLASYKTLIMLFVVFNFFMTFICNIGLIRYATKSSDAELCANKWVLAVLSLSLGGFFTPFALTWLPDTDVKATKNARVVLVRYLGSAWVVASFVSLITLLAFYGSASIKVWPDNTQSTFIIVMVVLGVVGLLGTIFVVPFYASNTTAHMIAQTTRGKWYRGVATLYTVIVTILLIIQIISAILKAIEAISRVFQRGTNGIQIFFNIINAMFTLISVAFMIYLITRVIKGLWQSDNNYHIHIPQYRTESQIKETNY